MQDVDLVNVSPTNAYVFRAPPIDSASKIAIVAASTVWRNHDVICENNLDLLESSAVHSIYTSLLSQRGAIYTRCNSTRPQRKSNRSTSITRKISLQLILIHLFRELLACGIYSWISQVHKQAGVVYNVTHNHWSNLKTEMSFSQDRKRKKQLFTTCDDGKQLIVDSHAWSALLNPGINDSKMVCDGVTRMGNMSYLGKRFKSCLNLEVPRYHRHFVLLHRAMERTELIEVVDVVCISFGCLWIHSQF